MQIRILATLLILSSLFNAYQFGSLFVGCEECWPESDGLEIAFRVTAILLVLLLGILVWLKKPWSRYFVYLYSILAAGALIFVYFSFLLTGSYQAMNDLIRTTTLAILIIAITVWACFAASKLKAGKNG